MDKKELKSKLKCSSEKFAFILLNLFFLQILLYFYNRYTCADFLQILLLTASILLSFFCFYSDIKIKIQILIIQIFFLAIWIAGFLCINTIKVKSGLIIYGGACLLVGVIVQIFGLVHEKKERISGKWPKGAIVIAICFVILSFETLEEVPLFDSGAYYSWNIDILSEHFNFTPYNVLDYCLAGHISVGYSLFVLLGELISPYTTYGVHMVNLILAIMSIFAFYGILKNIFPQKTEVEMGIYTGIFAFSPYMLGLIGTINIDIPGIYFFVIMFYCFIKEYRLLAFCCAWVFTCIKEPNVIYYIFFLLGILISQCAKKEQGNFKNRIKEGLYTCMYGLPILYWYGYFMAPGREFWPDTEYFINESGIHTFGFSWSNVLIKMKEIFLFNFNWIYTVLFVVVIVLLFLQKRIRKCMSSTTTPMISTLIGVLLFNAVYLDYPHPRYIALGAEIVLMLGVIILAEINIQYTMIHHI